MRFCIVVFIAVLAAMFGAGYLGLGLVSTAVICLATAFLAVLVQVSAIADGHSPFGGGEERET